MSWFKTKPKKTVKVKVGLGQATVILSNGTQHYIPIKGKYWFSWGDEHHVLTAQAVYKNRFGNITSELIDLGDNEFIPVRLIESITFKETDPDWSIEVEE